MITSSEKCSEKEPEKITHINELYSFPVCFRMFPKEADHMVLLLLCVCLEGVVIITNF